MNNLTLKNRSKIQVGEGSGFKLCQKRMSCSEDDFEVSSFCRDIFAVLGMRRLRGVAEEFMVWPMEPIWVNPLS